MRLKNSRTGAWLGLFVLSAATGAAKPVPPKPLPVKLTAEISDRFNWDLRKENAWENPSETTLDLKTQLKYLPNPVVQVIAGQWMVDEKPRPYNIYLNLAFNHVNVRLGNQIVHWGKADEISPLDVLNPEDLTLGLTRLRADRKIPVPMANLELLSEIVSIQGIFIPFPQKSIFHYAGDDWALFGPLNRVAPTFTTLEERPPQTLRQAEYGGRLSATLGRLDLAFVYLNHQPNTPSMKPFPFPVANPTSQEATRTDLVALSTTTHIPLQFHYGREELYGCEFETTIGPLGFRGDAAYVSSQSFITATLQEERRPVLTGVIGLDYNGPNSSYLNVSFQQRHIQKFDPALAPHKKNTSTLSGQFSWEILSGNIKVGYWGLINLEDKSFYQGPKLNINYIPNVGIETGVDLYNGPPASPLGFYGGNDQVFLTLKYFF